MWRPTTPCLSGCAGRIRWWTQSWHAASSTVKCETSPSPSTPNPSGPGTLARCCTVCTAAIEAEAGPHGDSGTRAMSCEDGPGQLVGISAAFPRGNCRESRVSTRLHALADGEAVINHQREGVLRRVQVPRVVRGLMRPAVDAVLSRLLLPPHAATETLLWAATAPAESVPPHPPRRPLLPSFPLLHLSPSSSFPPPSPPLYPPPHFFSCPIPPSLSTPLLPHPTPHPLTLGLIFCR